MLAVPHAISLLATIGRLSARQLLLLAGLLAGVPLVFAPNDVVVDRLQCGFALRHDLGKPRSGLSDHTKF